MLHGNDFSQGARDALMLALDEANRLGHEYVGTEHLLLALLRAPDATSVELLARLSVDVDELRSTVDRIVTGGKTAGCSAELPYTSRSKQVLELSMAAASELGHPCAGTEHLLLGLVREREGIGAQVLIASGVTADDTVRAILSLQGSSQDGAATNAHTRAPPGAQVTRVVIEVQHADGAVTRHECDTMRDAIVFLLDL